MSTSRLLPVLHPQTVLHNNHVSAQLLQSPGLSQPGPGSKPWRSLLGVLVASEILLNSLKGFGGTALVKGLLFLPPKDFSCPEGLADFHLTTTESKQKHLNCSIPLVDDTEFHSLVTPAASAQRCHCYPQTGGTKAWR